MDVLAATPAKSSGFNPSTLILILVVVVAFYMLMIRPQRAGSSRPQQKQNTVQPGARVRTTAGMYATVVDVDGDDVILEVAPGVEVRYMKRAVMDVVSPGEAVDEDVGAGRRDRHRRTSTASTRTTTRTTSRRTRSARAGDRQLGRRRGDGVRAGHRYQEGLTGASSADNARYNAR